MTDRAHGTVAGHRATITRLLTCAPPERVLLDWHATGRRLAGDLLAVDDLPRFDSSAMDGYAVHPGPTGGCTYVVVGDVPAGDPARLRVGPGEAARIMTGARVPEGATSVVPVEQTDAAPTGPAPARVTLHGDPGPPVAGRHVRRRAEDVAAGDLIAGRGTVLTAPVIALARSAGCVTADVHVRTRVGVVATGTELAAPGVDPGAGGIHESNSDMIAALAHAAGCVVSRVVTCGDEPAELTALLDELDAAGDLDLIVTTGGVSQGAFEVVRQVCGGLPSFEFTHLAMQPGGPQGLGTYGSTPVVCLPGTPVGAFVSFEMLLRPALAARHGSPTRLTSSAAYDGPTRTVRVGKVQFVTASLHGDGTVAAAPGRHLRALARANALIQVPEEAARLTAGDVVTVHPLQP